MCQSLNSPRLIPDPSQVDAKSMTPDPQLAIPVPQADLNADIFNAPPLWFDYGLRVHPHHTDYAGVVWHGSYIAWLEEARIEALASVGAAFSDLVTMDCDLPVVAMQLRYHRAVKMGETVIVRSRITRIDKIRIYWEQRVCAANPEGTHSEPDYLSATLELVPVNRAIGKVLRKFPAPLASALAKLQGLDSLA
jgi:acyl-CoA thioester hydrolase